MVSKSVGPTLSEKIQKVVARGRQTGCGFGFLTVFGLVRNQFLLVSFSPLCNQVRKFALYKKGLLKGTSIFN